MTTIKKWIASLLAIALCATMLAIPAMAYERVDTGKKTSLELNYKDESRDLSISGMELRIYQVCTMTDAVRFAMTPDFEGAGVAITSDMDAGKWASLANTLASYANTHDEIAPAATLETDGNGTVKFDELSVGLYLVTGRAVTLSGYKYTPTSFLLTLPNLNTEEDVWEYDVVASNKFTRKKLNDGPSTVSRNVLKVWEGDEGEERPESVTVSLLKDGKVYDTVTLNETNNWKHSWTGLDSDYQWTLSEVDVPEDYTVLVEQTGNTFVVTNTYEIEIEPPDVPLDPPPEEPGIDIPDDEVPKDDGRLPQTGILWWPVQLLTLAGIVLFSVGWIKLKRSKKDRNEP